MDLPAARAILRLVPTQSVWSARLGGGGRAAISPEMSRVSKAWPTTHAQRGDREQPPADEAALSARLQRLGERLGARPSRAVLPKVIQGRDRPPIRRRSPVAFGCRPNSWPESWSARHRLAARSLAGNFAVGDDRISAARFRRGRSQRDAGGGRGPGQNAGPTGSEVMKTAALGRRAAR